LRLHKVPNDQVRQRVERAADLLELREFFDRKPAQLSGGQRQRVAMGRAIVRDADAFLFGEPLSNLDAKLRGQVRTEISRLQNRLGITTVYVTHDQVEATTLGDRVAVLPGACCSRWTCLANSTSSRSTCSWPGFIGSPPMNFIPAGVEGATLHLPTVVSPR
jgi:multiple sugar transport system ATP-binding protein